MSRGHFSRSSEIAHLIAEVRRITAVEALDVYGIEFVQIGKLNGKVFDTTTEQEYENLNEWAQAVVDEDLDEYAELEHEASKYDEDN